MAEDREDEVEIGGHYPVISRVVESRARRKGLRPRLAASVIAVFWLGAIVVFGIVEHLIDPRSFGTIWEGMWWATQTVTTVGYGDIVPEQTAGRIVATFLLIGGLSFFAVITAVITSAFVARARSEAAADADAELRESLARMQSELEGIRAEMRALGGGPESGRGDDR